MRPEKRNPRGLAPQAAEPPSLLSTQFPGHQRWTGPLWASDGARRKQGHAIVHVPGRSENSGWTSEGAEPLSWRTGVALPPPVVALALPITSYEDPRFRHSMAPFPGSLQPRARSGFPVPSPKAPRPSSGFSSPSVPSCWDPHGASQGVTPPPGGSESCLHGRSYVPGGGVWLGRGQF